MLNDLNGARLLVVLPLNERQRALLREAAPAAQFRFADDAPALADVLWAEGILGHVPVELVRQNRSLRWLQSDYAGPDIYLAPGVLPEVCVVTNATGPTAWPSANGCWRCGWGCARTCFCTATARPRTAGRRWTARCAAWPGHACCARGWAISAQTLPAAPMRWGLRSSACGAPPTRRALPAVLPARGGPGRAGRPSCPPADLVALSLPGTGEGTERACLTPRASRG